VPFAFTELGVAMLSSVLNSDTAIEAMLQLKLTGDKREKVLKLIFGDNDLEFLNEQETVKK